MTTPHDADTARAAGTESAEGSPVEGGGRPIPFEWYRPDPRARVRSVCLRASALLVAGMALSGLAFGRQYGVEAPLRIPFVIAGVLLTAGGPLHLAVALQRILGDETAVILRSDGLVHVGAEGVLHMPWEEVMGADTDEEGHLRVLRRDRPPYPIPYRFAYRRPEEIARRIEDVRRKVLMGLLPEAAPEE